MSSVSASTLASSSVSTSARTSPPTIPSLKRDRSEEISGENIPPPVAAEPAKKRRKGVPVPRVQSIPKSIPIPVYAGNMDLYSMNLPFLKQVYLPEGSSGPQYENLYNTILTYQSKPDYTAQSYLPIRTSATQAVSGLFSSTCIDDPMCEMPWEISIHSIQDKKPLSFTPMERRSFAAPNNIPPGPGIAAKTSLVRGRCGVNTASGVFKLQRVWAQTTTSGEVRELFEGFFTFNVRFNSMYTKAGFGNNQKFKMAFWAVRARKDNTGKEIGLERLED